jgi:hypothetical protein
MHACRPPTRPSRRTRLFSLAIVACLVQVSSPSLMALPAVPDLTTARVHDEPLRWFHTRPRGEQLLCACPEGCLATAALGTAFQPAAACAPSGYIGSGSAAASSAGGLRGLGSDGLPGLRRIPILHELAFV